MSENIYVNQSIKGKRIVDTSTDGKFMNFYFEDNSYDVAPIIDGVVRVELDNEEAVIPEAELTEEEAELGFYKTLVEIPYTDEHGNELGKTEIGSIQEVPVALGDMWVENNMAEKVEKPEKSLLSKVTGGLLGNK